VAAFEELVGSHGGLGGWQTEAMLVHPADWQITQGDLIGPDAVHRQLVEWLAALGLRTRTPAQDELVADEALELVDLAPRGTDRDGAAARLSPSRDR
jgi:hypothetical protein